MPRPMRLALPVTRTILPARSYSDCWFAMDFDLLRLDSGPGRLGQAAGEMGPAPEYRGCGTKRAGDGPDGARVPVLRSDAGQQHGEHHDAPRGGFHGGEDAPAEGIGDMAQELRHVQHRAKADPGARKGDEDQRAVETAHLAEGDVRAAVNDIADDDGALIVLEAEPTAGGEGERPAAEEADACESPDEAQTVRAAVENHFSEDAEEDLSRAAARGPADVDTGKSEDQRNGAHVAQTLGVFVPGAYDVVFGERASGRLKSAAGKEEARNAQCRDHKRERVSGERQLVAELHDAGAAQERADRKGGPLRGLGERVGGVEFLFSGYGGQDRRAAAGEKRRREHQQGAQHIQQ